MDLKYKVIDSKFYNIKDVLRSKFQVSSRLYTKLKNNKHIYLNGSNSFFSDTINLGDIIEVDLGFEETSENIVPTKMELDILFEDNYLLILNKPSNIAVHPSLRHYETSLSNGVKDYFNQIKLNRKIRIVNRLDKDTSGIVIFAKNEYIQETLTFQMKNNEFKKEYIAILDGILDKKVGTIDAPIGRKNGSIIERCIDINGQRAVTNYDVIKEKGNFSIVHFILETGRTHQIRVHSKYIGHPIIGDTLYGTASNLIDRQALHAYKVSFIHPISKEKMEINAPLPEDMKKIIDK